MKTIRRLLLPVLFLACALALCACSIRKIDRVEIKSGSFKEDYAVDEKLDLSHALLSVVYDKGEEDVAIESDMITGFDASTTGNKKLTVTYKGYTAEVEYRVYNPENASKEIVTTARLALFADGGDGYVEYSVHFQSGDLPAVRAASFTLRSGYALGLDATLSALTVSSDFRSASYKCSLSEDGTALRVVLFCANSTFPTGGVLAKFRVAGGTNRSVSLCEATLSDGTTDYWLPPVA